MSRSLIESAHALAALLEATGEYYYDTRGVKRWILGDGGRSGNCETCVDNADLGWIDQDATFEGVFGDVDEPEAHPNCTCSIEYGEQRYRVYTSGKGAAARRRRRRAR